MTDDRALVARNGNCADLVVEREVGTAELLTMLAQGIQSPQWDDVILEVDKDQNGTRMKFRAYRHRRTDG